MALPNNTQVGLRSLVGVGEAAYVVIATPMIADFFPSKVRPLIRPLIIV